MLIHHDKQGNDYMAVTVTYFGLIAMKAVASF
jgi:hypothetical protein